MNVIKYNFRVLGDGSQMAEDALLCCSSVDCSLNTYRSCFYFLEFLVFPWKKGGGRSGVGGEESVEMKICFTLVHVLVLGSPLQKLGL